MISNTPEIKQLNTESIRREMQRHPASTKADIAKYTSLSMATCNTILNEMEARGEICQIDQEMVKVGRPASRYEYNAEYLHVLVSYVALQNHVYTASIAIADAYGKIIFETQKEAAQFSFAEYKQMIADAVANDSLISFIMVGIPGITHHGVVERCNIKEMIGIDVEGEFQEAFRINTQVRNDLDSIAKGTYALMEEKRGMIATLFFSKNEGTVGCGFVIDGKTAHGSSKFIGEISYTAAAFGISREEQSNILKNGSREEYRLLAGKMAMILIGTIDPSAIMIMGNGTDADDLDAIRAFCSNIVPANHIPKLYSNNDVNTHYLRGMITAALESVLFPIIEG